MTDVNHSKRQPDLIDDAVNGALVSEAKTPFSFDQAESYGNSIVCGS
jgi:hypothetical protein